MFDSISISVSWKPSIGIYGISVKKTMIDGKNAKKKLNANDDALVVIAPSCNPLMKKTATSYKLRPLKLNGLIFLKIWVKLLMTLLNLNQSF